MILLQFVYSKINSFIEPILPIVKPCLNSLFSSCSWFDKVNVATETSTNVVLHFFYTVDLSYLLLIQLPWWHDLIIEVIFKGSLFPSTITGWQIATCVDILVTALHWLAMKMKLKRWLLKIKQKRSLCVQISDCLFKFYYFSSLSQCLWKVMFIWYSGWVL